MARIAINGLGRIGRAALKIAIGMDGVDMAAVNDLVSADNLAYLLRYDTVYGRYGRPVTAAGDSLIVDGRPVRVLACRDPAGCRGRSSAWTWCWSAPELSAARRT